jgi:hypothetical protein
MDRTELSNVILICRSKKLTVPLEHLLVFYVHELAVAGAAKGKHTTRCWKADAGNTRNNGTNGPCSRSNHLVGSPPNTALRAAGGWFGGCRGRFLIDDHGVGRKKGGDWVLGMKYMRQVLRKVASKAR